MKIILIQLINYTLSFLMWVIIGRYILTLIIGNRQNIISNAFVKITDPIFRLTQRIVPFAKGGWVPFFSILFILLIRYILIIIIFRPTADR